jgi:hypothetical protein
MIQSEWSCTKFRTVAMLQLRLDHSQTCCIPLLLVQMSQVRVIEIRDDNVPKIGSQDVYGLAAVKSGGKTSIFIFTYCISASEPWRNSQKGLTILCKQQQCLA